MFDTRRHPAAAARAKPSTGTSGATGRCPRRRRARGRTKL